MPRFSAVPAEGIRVVPINATIIDLTIDDDEPVPQAPRRQVLRRARPSKRSKSDSELVELTSHHQLTFWKNELFQQLGMEAEYQLAIRTPHEAAKIKTLVTDRYLRVAGVVVGQRRKRSPRTTYQHFPGKVEIHPPVKAIRQAYEEHLLPGQDPHRLVLYTDGSHSKHNSGLAVVCRQPLVNQGIWGPWEAHGFNSQGRRVGSFEMEYLAVIKAFDIGSQKVKQQSDLKEIAIYSDAVAVLRKLQLSSGGPLIVRIIKKAKALQALGPKISLYWCPAHSKVPGNELADRIAARARQHDYEEEDEYIDLSSDEEDEYIVLSSDEEDDKDAAS